MDKDLKTRLEQAFTAGRISGYWEQDPEGCREVNGYYFFYEWIKYIESKGIETPDEMGNCIKPAVTASDLEIIAMELLKNGSYFYKAKFEFPNEITKKLCRINNLNNEEYISH